MKIALLFPGYGSQFVGMGKELYNESRIVQEYFDEASNCLDINFVKLCFASSDLEISKMNHAYTSIFLLSSAIYALLKEAGIQPTVAAGYNLGEYSAFFAANSITLPDGLYLLNKFALFYEEMLKDQTFEIVRVRGIDTDTIKNMCVKASSADNNAHIASYSSEIDHVISGHKDAIERVRAFAFEYAPDVLFDSLPIEFGLHSASMEPVTQNLKMYLEKVDFKDPHIPLISSVNGHIITQGDTIKDHVLKLIVSPILWTRIMQIIGECDLIIEVGPGNSLESVVKSTYPDKLYQNVNKQADIDKLISLVTPITPVTPDVET